MSGVHCINRVFANSYLHILFAVFPIYNQISIGVMMHKSTEKTILNFSGTGKSVGDTNQQSSGTIASPQGKILKDEKIELE